MVGNAAAHGPGKPTYTVNMLMESKANHSSLTSLRSNGIQKLGKNHSQELNTEGQLVVYTREAYLGMFLLKTFDLLGLFLENLLVCSVLL